MGQRMQFKCMAVVGGGGYLRSSTCSREATHRMTHPKTGKAVNVCRQHMKKLTKRGFLLVGEPS